jgi:hypothetical protein
VGTTRYTYSSGTWAGTGTYPVAPGGIDNAGYSPSWTPYLSATRTDNAFLITATGNIDTDTTHLDEWNITELRVLTNNHDDVTLN